MYGLKGNYGQRTLSKPEFVRLANSIFKRLDDVEGPQFIGSIEHEWHEMGVDSKPSWDQRQYHQTIYSVTQSLLTAFGIDLSGNPGKPSSWKTEIMDDSDPSDGSFNIITGLDYMPVIKSIMGQGIDTIIYGARSTTDLVRLPYLFLALQPWLDQLGVSRDQYKKYFIDLLVNTMESRRLEDSFLETWIDQLWPGSPEMAPFIEKRTRINS